MDIQTEVADKQTGEGITKDLVDLPGTITFEVTRRHLKLDPSSSRTCAIATALREAGGFERVIVDFRVTYVFKNDEIIATYVPLKPDYVSKARNRYHWWPRLILGGFEVTLTKK